MYKFTTAYLIIAALLWGITIGHVYGQTKNHKAVAPLNLVALHDTVISGLDIAGDTSACITLSNCYNIIIKNSTFHNSIKNGLNIYNCSNITVQGCYFENVATGVYALESQGINISYNQFKNMRGPFPRGQFVQFDDVSGSNNRVNYNSGENFPGKSDPQDAINMFKTNGTFYDPVQIVGNRIRGGGPSKYGGGIMLGDNGGSYLTASDNILVDPGQYGMAIAGGTNIKIINNTIYAKQQPFTNVGIYIWNQSKYVCALNTISGNKVNWTKADGEIFSNWNNGNCGSVIGWDNNNWKARIGPSILPDQLLINTP
ncbi:right-handed parallel beta-helix repeat-containing protein [Mucilaginibacter segetis]|uniref:Right-handed parallel beta-helix repeat-containing protein n=1 Tax=Mucilaginibacter segetis TaxID=2793071 RepID=A0A934PX82_9SPHI|nr:right-handed parallel beta-helix repeat-containing protein [Mucilaginibacter segetis]MBK0380698.1 right-handed parallel beta-helix repeat-containing protein [Mucilaginibacter segetis]